MYLLNKICLACCVLLLAFGVSYAGEYTLSTYSGQWNDMDAMLAILDANGDGVFDYDTDSDGVIDIAASPWDIGGSDTYVQYNNSGAFGGNAGFTVNKTSLVVTAGGFNVNPTSYGGQYTYFYEATGTGSNIVGSGSPSSNDNDLILLYPTSDPLAGQVLNWAVPSSVTFSDNTSHDATQSSWTWKNKITTNTKTAAYTVGTDDAEECYGGLIYVTSAAVITACDNLADGMNFRVVTIGAIAVSVDMQSDDRQYLDGVALDDGDKATNTSTIGDELECVYESADGWYCKSYSPDGDHWTDGGA